MGGVIRCDEFAATPPPKPSLATRQIIAIDCEMVGVGGNRHEFVFLAVIDVLTGEVLINKFVKPTNIVQVGILV